MFSKDWKFSLSVVVVALAVAACTNKDDSEKIGDDRSPFVGIWASQHTIELNGQYQATIKQNKVAAFCTDIYGKSGSLKLDALLIRLDGAVYTYGAADEVSAEGFYRANHIGFVNNQGLFTGGEVKAQGKYEATKKLANAASFYLYEGVLEISNAGKLSRFQRIMDKSDLNDFQDMNKACTATASF